jgi:hypothetical protein
MVVIWLIKFTLVALIVIFLIAIGQKIIARHKARTEEHKFMQDLMRFEEAKIVIMQHASIEVRRGVPLDQALLKVLSDDYLPEPEAWEQDKTAEHNKTRPI